MEELRVDTSVALTMVLKLLCDVDAKLSAIVEVLDESSPGFRDNTKAVDRAGLSDDMRLKLINLIRKLPDNSGLLDLIAERLSALPKGVMH